MKLFYLTPIILQKLIWLPVRLTLVVFGKMEIYGVENLRSLKGNGLFVSNHTSELDACIVASSIPFWSNFSPVFFASRENKFYDTSGWRRHIYGGTFFKLFGAQPIYGGFKDYEKSLVNHVQLLKDGKSILIFPEGRITSDGSIQSAHGGVAYLAAHSTCHIIPVAISGAYRMSLSDFFCRRRTIIIRFGQPIHRDEFEVVVHQDADPFDNIYRREADYMMEKIQELLRTPVSFE